MQSWQSSRYEDYIILADSYWDLGPGGGGSPGNDDSGRVALVRKGTQYFFVNKSGCDVTWDRYEADSDEMALDRFRDEMQDEDLLL